MREYHRTRRTPTDAHRQWLGHMATLHPRFTPLLRIGWLHCARVFSSQASSVRELRARPAAEDESKDAAFTRARLLRGIIWPIREQAGNNTGTFSWTHWFGQIVGGWKMATLARGWREEGMGGGGVRICQVVGPWGVRAGDTTFAINADTVEIILVTTQTEESSEKRNDSTVHTVTRLIWHSAVRRVDTLLIGGRLYTRNGQEIAKERRNCYKRVVATFIIATFKQTLWARHLCLP